MKLKCFIFIILLSTLFSGCVQRWVEVDLETVPNGAFIYYDSWLKGKYVYVNQVFVDRDADEHGMIYAGKSPLKIHFQVKLEDRKSGNLELPKITAKWISGAQATTDYNAKLNNRKVFIQIFRPSDFPGLTDDQKQSELALREEQNRIGQEGVDEAGKSRNQSGFLGILFACIFTGHCR